MAQLHMSSRVPAVTAGCKGSACQGDKLLQMLNSSHSNPSGASQLCFRCLPLHTKSHLCLPLFF
jgi:hypothetical protein